MTGLGPGQVKAAQMDFSLPHFNPKGWRHLYNDMFFVSPFDHWLNEHEPVSFLWFDQARSKGLLDQYLNIETRFWTFLEGLIGDQAVYCNRVNLHDDILRFHIKRFKGVTSELRKRLTQTLRERRGGDDDIYLPETGVRIMFGRDMTHALYFRDAAAVSAVKELIKSVGLHALDTTLDGWGDPFDFLEERPGNKICAEVLPTSVFFGNVQITGVNGSCLDRPASERETELIRSLLKDQRHIEEWPGTSAP